ncbi:MAG: DUF4396 domain-containing protein [Candidatus Lokiarchaeota archaeon]|nr:DUF4396 domain-containing protein [Candidatus Lokiarchaeota archaeon]
MEKDTKKLAFRTTLHCVIGCGTGDTLGLIIGTVLSWSVFPTMILGIILGFMGGYSLTMIPLLKRGFNIKAATKITVVSETASILVMETAENLTAFLIPGLLVASFLTSLFWGGFLLSVVAGFLAAYPINYFMISKGLRKPHIHH